MSHRHDYREPLGGGDPLRHMREAAGHRRALDLESSMLIPALSGNHDLDELRLLVHQAQIQKVSTGSTCELPTCQLLPDFRG